MPRYKVMYEDVSGTVKCISVFAETVHEAEEKVLDNIPECFHVIEAEEIDV